MNRIIKFRAWDKKNKRWVEPESRCIGFDGSIGICENQFHSLDEDFPILQQFTGLLDKNGKEIYESDIVKTKEIPRSYIFYCKIHACFILGINIMGDPREGGNVTADTHIASLENNIEDSIEVIGNIYENPELLNND